MPNMLKRAALGKSDLGNLDIIRKIFSVDNLSKIQQENISEYLATNAKDEEQIIISAHFGALVYDSLQVLNANSDYQYNQSIHQLEKTYKNFKKEQNLSNKDLFALIKKLSLEVKSTELKSIIEVISLALFRLREHIELLKEFTVLNKIGRILPSKYDNGKNYKDFLQKMLFNEKESPLKDGEIIEIEDEPNALTQTKHKYKAVAMVPKDEIFNKPNSRLIGLAFIPEEENSKEYLNVYFTWQGTKNLTNAKANIEKSAGENTYKESEQEVLDKTISIIKDVQKKYPNKKLNLVFQGHSLGGAISQLHFNTIQRLIANEKKLEHLTQLPKYRKIINFDHELDISKIKKMTISLCNSTGVLHKVGDNSSIIADKLHGKGVKFYGNYLLFEGDPIQTTGQSMVLAESQKSRLKMLKVSDPVNNKLGYYSKLGITLAATAFGTYKASNKFTKPLGGALGFLSSSLFISGLGLYSHVSKTLTKSNTLNMFHANLYDSEAGDRDVIKKDILNKSNLINMIVKMNLANLYDLPNLSKEIPKLVDQDKLNLNILKDFFKEVCRTYSVQHWGLYTCALAEDGYSLLHKLILKNDIETIKDIINICEERNIKFSKLFDLEITDKDGFTPIELAVFENKEDIFELLLEHYSLNYMQEAFLRKYMFEVSSKKDKELLYYKVNNPLVTSISDLQFKCRYTDFLEIKEYLEENPSKISNDSHRDLAGNSAFQLMCLNLEVDELKEVLKIKQKGFFFDKTVLDTLDIEKTNLYGMKSYQVAAFAGKTEMVTFLLDEIYCQEELKEELIQYSKLSEEQRINTIIPGTLELFNQKVLENLKSNQPAFENSAIEYLTMFKDFQNNDAGVVQYILKFKQYGLLEEILKYKSIREKYIQKYLTSDVISKIDNMKLKHLISDYKKVITYKYKNKHNYGFFNFNNGKALLNKVVSKFAS